MPDGSLPADGGRPLPWRTGRRVGRHIYDAAGEVVGMVDTEDLASAIVAAVNQRGLPLGTVTLYDSMTHKPVGQIIDGHRVPLANEDGDF